MQNPKSLSAPIIVMTLRNIGIFAWLLLLSAFTVSAETPEGKSVSELTSRFDQLAPKLLADNIVPGVAIAVIQDGKVVFRKGYGFADVENKLAVTPKTGFNIGSISKTVAAWGLMTLVEAGKLGLDTPVEKYLTRWHLPDTEFDNKGVTLRRLLSHTAGLSLHGYPGWGPNDPLPSVEGSLSGNNNGPGEVRLIMQPGTNWKYSGGGYTLSQLLVEEMTGQLFSDYMREKVLLPLGMTTSDYHLNERILDNSSIAYDGWGDPTPNPRFTAQAAAGLHTTLDDLARFATAALTSPSGDKPGRGVLKAETLTEMMTPAPASDDRYGLGYSIAQLSDDLTASGHGGANRGWHSVFQIVPATGDGIVVLTNGSNGWFVHRGIFVAWKEWITGQPEEKATAKPIAVELIRTLKKGDAAAAIKRYRALKKNQPDDYRFDEGQLNRLGYQLLGRERVGDAIEIFKLNVEIFPEASNPYDSLGEAYMINGDTELAIKNYAKSVELNPENTHGADMLKKLRKELEVSTR